MKKISMLLMTIVLSLTLAGCGKSGKITSSTCTLNQNNIEQTFKMTATDDEIDKIDMTMVYDSKTLGVNSLSDLTDEQKEQVKTTMLKTLGLEGTYEGLEIDIDIQDKMTVTIKMDLKKADKDVLKKLKLDFTNADMSLKKSVKQMEEEGATCK